MTTSQVSAQPEEFRLAVRGLSTASTRREITLGPLRPPRQLAPHAYALGAEVAVPDDDGECMGRLILLHDPDGHEAWEGTLRLVAYVQAELDAQVAADPMLPEVAWSWLTDALDDAGAQHTALGGTVTATASVRFGDIAGPPRNQQVELRASWTIPPDSGAELETLLAAHAEAFCAVLSAAAGLPPAGVTSLASRTVG